MRYLGVIILLYSNIYAQIVPIHRALNLCENKKDLDYCVALKIPSYRFLTPLYLDKEVVRTKEQEVTSVIEDYSIGCDKVLYLKNADQMSDALKDSLINVYKDVFLKEGNRLYGEKFDFPFKDDCRIVIRSSKYSFFEYLLYVGLVYELLDGFQSYNTGFDFQRSGSYLGYFNDYEPNIDKIWINPKMISNEALVAEVSRIQPQIPIEIVVMNN